MLENHVVLNDTHGNSTANFKSHDHDKSDSISGEYTHVVNWYPTKHSE